MCGKNEGFNRAEAFLFMRERSKRGKGKLFGGSKAGKYQRKKCM